MVGSGGHSQVEGELGVSKGKWAWESLEREMAVGTRLWQLRVPHSAGGWSGSWGWAGGTGLGGTVEGSPQRPRATPQPLPLCSLLQPWRCLVLRWPPRRPRVSCCCCRSKHWLRRRRPKPSGICSVASCRSGTPLQPPPVASKLHPLSPQTTFPQKMPPSSPPGLGLPLFCCTLGTRGSPSPHSCPFPTSHGLSTGQVVP